MDPRVEALVKLLSDAVSGHAQLLKLQEELGAAVDKARSLDELKNAFKAINDRFASVARPQAERLAAALKAAPTLDPAPPKSSILPADLAKQFRTLIDTAQQEARTPGAGDTAATIKSLDVEVKGLIVVQNDQATIVPPQPDKPIDAGQLSTIRMTFASIPVLRPAPPDDTQK